MVSTISSDSGLPGMSPISRGLPSRPVSASAGVARFWKVRGAVVAIGIQKLSAGSGYEYLTRQVAAMDATGRGHSTLSDCLLYTSDAADE